jgi:hypothetical protein
MSNLMEYRELNQKPELRGQETVLDEGVGERNTLYKLTHKTAGYYCAGSCARFDNEAYGVIFEAHGSRHGRWFKTEAEARELFGKWTAVAA